MTGSIAISGTVNNPKVKITSTPDLPQDEVLGQLLFHRSSDTDQHEVRQQPLKYGEIALYVPS